jgi:glucose-1-phosphate thymidylyltransferase
MKIIIPMAGRGSRLRPHTLTVPKPLIPIAGKPIVQRLVEDIVALYDGKVDEIAFVIGDFGKEVEKQLLAIAEEMGAKGHIFVQDEPLGTAHAIWMAESVLGGEVIIAFADTLFVANFTLDRTTDGAIWVNSVEDPRQFGVVTLDENGIIKAMVEKPQEFVSDLAIIGIYYIREGEKLHAEIKHLLDNDLREKGEYQLTNALENMKEKGAKFMPGKVEQWMDCGNKKAVLDTTRQVLELESKKGNNLVSEDLDQAESLIVQPCFIGKNVRILGSRIGPYVSVGDNTTIVNSVITSSTIGFASRLDNAVLENSMVGNYSQVGWQPKVLSVGDFSRITE